MPGPVVNNIKIDAKGKNPSKICSFSYLNTLCFKNKTNENSAK